MVQFFVFEFLFMFLQATSNDISVMCIGVVDIDGIFVFLLLYNPL